VKKKKFLICSSNKQTMTSKEPTLFVNFRLRKTVRENHQSVTRSIAFNRVEPVATNVVASVGGNQVWRLFSLAPCGLV
jgi:hypothetical protein